MAIGKRRQRFCAVGPRVTAETILSCSSGTHAHFSWSEINLMRTEGEIEPLGLTPEELKETHGEADFVFRWLTPRILQWIRHVPTRGLSSKYGVVIEEALRLKKKWARVWVDEVKGEIETELTRAHGHGPDNFEAPDGY